MARAKRDRVVQDEVENANRRPDRPDPTRHPSLLFWNLTIFDETPYLKMDHFRRKFVKSGRTPHLKTGHFRRKLVKVCEIEAHSSCENLPFSTKIGENWWNWGAIFFWKLAIFDENSWTFVNICEIEAHSFFWKLTLSDENSWNWGALLIWKLAIFDEHWRTLMNLRRTSYLKTD